MSEGGRKKRGCRSDNPPTEYDFERTKQLPRLSLPPNNTLCGGGASTAATGWAEPAPGFESGYGWAYPANGAGTGGGDGGGASGGGRGGTFSGWAADSVGPAAAGGAPTVSGGAVVPGLPSPPCWGEGGGQACHAAPPGAAGWRGVGWAAPSGGRGGSGGREGLARAACPSVRPHASDSDGRYDPAAGGPHASGPNPPAPGWLRVAQPGSQAGDDSDPFRADWPHW